MKLCNRVLCICTIFLFTLSISLLGQSETLKSANGEFDLEDLRSQLSSMEPQTPNPYLSFLPAGVEGDFDYWDLFLQLKGKERALAMGGANKQVVTVAEVEPNGTAAEATAVSGFGFNADGEAILTGDLEVGGADYFSFELDEGDIIGASLTGSAGLYTLNPSLDTRHSSGQDLSSLYGDGKGNFSPLPGGGNSVIAYIADVTGTHYFRVRDIGSGPYTIDLKVFRAETRTGIDAKQILYVDFDGETINAFDIWGFGNTNAVLSPLVDFLPNWGLTAADEDAVIDAILASIEESTITDLNGLATDFGLTIENSRDHPDPGNAAPYSRLIVGGTIEELGIQTLGIASAIDPGNFYNQNVAVTLLDLLSEPDPLDPFYPNSLNQYAIDPSSNIIDLIAAGVGNITAHEAGHYLGQYHTENQNALPAIQDRGGNLANSVGIGADNVFGTADDFDVDFVLDAYSSVEGFVGEESLGERIAWSVVCIEQTLPVELTSFVGHATDSQITLEWATATEIDNSGFHVELRTDNGFSNLGFVDGSGTTESVSNYSFVVRDLLPGIHGFRLRQVDFSGEESYSELIEVAVGVPDTHVLTSAYPNPFNPEASFSLAVDVTQEVRIELYNSLGQVVEVIHEGEMVGGQAKTFRIDGSNLTSGAYFYRAVGSQFISATKALTLTK